MKQNGVCSTDCNENDYKKGVLSRISKLIQITPPIPTITLFL